jgi:antitoxin (DNA-binding transcriptional repressor) of toxin-antitoxin stability system
VNTVNLIYPIPSWEMVRLTATEVARNFSAVLNRVGAGEEVEIVRNNMVIAELRAPAAPTTISADQWIAMMASAPPVDGGFAADIERARAALPEPPPDAWAS